MRATDITVEVRDKNLVRHGVIRPEDLVLELSDNFNNVGSWKISLPTEHPLAAVLRTPGSGVIVTGPSDVLTSGPTVKSELASTPEDPGGTVTFEGVSDDVVLSDMLAVPQPSNPDLASQTLAHDVRTGPVESVMHGFVSANVGPTAPAVRRRGGLTMGADFGRGPVITKSARFPVLGNLLAEVAPLGNLGYRVIQRGSHLAFETYEVVDRSRAIRLDARNRTLSGQRVQVGAPGATRVLVAGQGDLAARQFLAVDNASSLAAEADWGRRIEKFVDQRNTADWSELKQAGDELLADQGATTIGVQAVPVEDTTMRFGIDWFLGDRVGVVVEDQELSAVVTGMALKASSDGFFLGALIGDPAGFSLDTALRRQVQRAENRLSALERTAEGGSSDSHIMSIMGGW